MTEWRKDTLGQIADAAGGLIRTGPFGSQLHSHEYVEGGPVAVVMPKDMVGGRIASTSVARVSIETASRLAAHRAHPGDIVLARRGDIGRAAWVGEHDGEVLCGTGSMRIHLPGGKLIPRYLHYFLQTRTAIDWLTGQAVGATMPNLNDAIVRALPVRYPSREVQGKIIGVLDAIESLIENNRQQIVLLDQMTQAIYREWFVHFRYPGHEDDVFVDSRFGPIPSGWDVVRLDDVLELRYGKALKAGARSGGSVAVVGSSGVVGWHSQSLVGGPGVVVGRKGNVGSVTWVPGDFWPIDTTYYVVTGAAPRYIYHLLRGVEFIDSHAAVPGLSREQAYALEVVQPPRRLLWQFDAVASELMGMAVARDRQDRALERLRDELLPRLVTGAIDVSQLDLDALLEQTAT